MALAKHMEELAEKTSQNLSGCSGSRIRLVDSYGLVHYVATGGSDERTAPNYRSPDYIASLYTPRRR